MNSKQIELYSPLSPAECAARLSAAIDFQPASGFSKTAIFGTKPVVGSVSADSLRLRKRLFYNNGFQTFLFATMRGEASGTLISGKFGMNPFMRVFAFVWLALSIFGSCLLLYSASDRPGEEWWKGVIIVPIMLAFGVLLAPLGRFLARNEPTFLTEFLQKSLDARQRN